MLNCERTPAQAPDDLVALAHAYLSYVARLREERPELRAQA